MKLIEQARVYFDPPTSVCWIGEKNQDGSFLQGQKIIGVYISAEIAEWEEERALWQKYGDQVESHFYRLCARIGQLLCHQ